MPYKFNGKEQDSLSRSYIGKQTGLYYYGARYYDAKECRFYGVDPLAEGYVFQSSFAYAANNPIRFIDWMGMNPEEPPVCHIQLDEVTVTAKAPSRYSSEGKYGAWSSSFKGSLAAWNRQYGDVGDNHEAAMDKWQKQMSHIENTAVKQSVSNAINKDGVTVALGTLALPATLIGGVEALPLLYQGARTASSIGMRQVALWEYWNGNIWAANELSKSTGYWLINTEGGAWALAALSAYAPEGIQKDFNINQGKELFVKLIKNIIKLQSRINKEFLNSNQNENSISKKH